LIVGRRPPKALGTRIANLAWVELAADVADVRPYLGKASVVVVPLRIGGGSRLKILEALAAGKAVVSTSIGAEGLAVVPNEHLRIADQPAEFARHVSELLGSPEARRRLGASGRKMVAERYCWEKMALALESAWLAACLPRTSGNFSTHCLVGRGKH
jgi:glycosyltransferase involved in cell wall biosynthesis